MGSSKLRGTEKGDVTDMVKMGWNTITWKYER